MAQVAGNRTGFGSLISSAADSLGDLGIEVGSGVVNSVTSAADSAAASAASATAQATAAAQSSTESFVQLAPDAVSEAQDQQATSNPLPLPHGRLGLFSSDRHLPHHYLHRKE